MSEPAELLAVWAAVRKTERRMRVADWVFPILCLTSMVWLGFDGVTHIEQGLTFALGFSTGAAIYTGKARRGNYRKLKATVELLEMHEAAFQTSVLEGEGWVCANCAGRIMGRGPECPRCGEAREDA